MKADANIFGNEFGDKKLGQASIPTNNSLGLQRSDKKLREPLNHTDNSLSPTDNPKVAFS